MDAILTYFFDGPLGGDAASRSPVVDAHAKVRIAERSTTDMNHQKSHFGGGGGGGGYTAPVLVGSTSTTTSSSSSSASTSTTYPSRQ
jgi:hypothetical protein